MGVDEEILLIILLIMRVERYVLTCMCFFPFVLDINGLSTCSLHTNNGCGKERRILIGPW